MDTPDHTLAHATQKTILHSPHPEGPDNDEIVVIGLDVVHQWLKRAAVVRAPFKGDADFSSPSFHDIQIGIGDQLQAHGDQRVMDLPLPFQFSFVLILLGQRILHLLEAIVMHLRGIHMAADQCGAKRLGPRNPDIDTPIRVLGVIDGDEQSFIHALALPSRALT